MEAVYLRRVKDPNPLLEELARQTVDKLEQIAAPGDAGPSFFAIAITAKEFGVPIAYVLAELERRARAAVPVHT